MGRNNICVIYDSDENYAKRLMSVINDDNDIPYNAQVFTKEHELDKSFLDNQYQNKILPILNQHF